MISRTRIFFILTGVAVSLAFPIVSAASGQSHTVTLDGAKVHYTSYGSGDSAILLVHGWACDETVWSAQVGPLSERIRTITIDLPGHGQSEKPKVAYTMDLYARAMFMVLRDAGVKSAVVVGHSNGVAAIRQLYRTFPAVVDALVIVEGGLRPFVDAANMEKFLAPLRGDHYEEAAGRFIDGMTKPIADEDLRSRIKTLMLRTPQYVAVSEFEKTADPDLWKEDTIDVPVLMILAKQPIWNAEYEKFAHQICPKVDYQVWDHTSHFIMMEKAQKFNGAVISFMEKHELLPEHS